MRSSVVVGLLLATLLAGCVTSGNTTVESEDPGHPSTAGGPVQVTLESDDRVLLLDIPKHVNASITWTVAEAEEPLGKRRAFFGGFLATPAATPARWAAWTFDIERPPVLVARHNDVGVEAGQHPEFPGLLWNPPFNVTWSLEAGRSAFILTSHGLRLPVEVELDPPTAWSLARWTDVESDISQFYSTSNPGEFEEHTEVTVGPNVAIAARTTVTMTTETTYLSAGTFASQGKLEIRNANGACEPRDFGIRPTGMRASYRYGGAGDYVVDVLGTASVVLVGTDVSIHALDVPFWSPPRLPHCFPG